MPVIRDQPSEQRLTGEKKERIVKGLTAELEGSPTSGGPVIFEMPIPGSDKIDVMVIWEEWEGVATTDRATLVKEAYKANADKLSLALGLTSQEALDEGVLPFRVRKRFSSQPKFSEEAIREAYLFAGAIVLPDGSLTLRFPTQAIAKAACQRLTEKLPGIELMVSYADA